MVQKSTAYIPEDVDVLNSSILNNILISNPDLNEQEVSRLLQNVGLDKELKKSDFNNYRFYKSKLFKRNFKKIHIERSISQKFASIYL